MCLSFLSLLTTSCQLLESLTLCHIDFKEPLLPTALSRTWTTGCSTSNSTDLSCFAGSEDNRQFCEILNGVWATRLKSLRLRSAWLLGSDIRDLVIELPGARVKVMKLSTSHCCNGAVPPALLFPARLANLLGVGGDKALLLTEGSGGVVKEWEGSETMPYLSLRLPPPPGPGGPQASVHAFSSRMFHQLATVDLSNALPPHIDAASSVLQALAQHCHHITSLSLAGNDFGCSLISYKIVPADSDQNTSTCADSLLHSLACALSGRSWPSLSCLILNSTSLEDAGIGLLAESFTKGGMRAMTHLEVRCCGFGFTGAEALCKCLETGRAAALRHLDISGNAIGDKGMCAIAHALESLPQLTVLQAMGCDATSVGIGSLFEGLLEGVCPLVTTLQLCCNPLRCKSGDAVVHLLKTLLQNRQCIHLKQLWIYNAPSVKSALARIGCECGGMELSSCGLCGS